MEYGERALFLFLVKGFLYLNTIIHQCRGTGILPMFGFSNVFYLITKAMLKLKQYRLYNQLNKWLWSI